MTWEPTEEMIDHFFNTVMHGTYAEAQALFIAIQPSIAAEARAMALEEAARLFLKPSTAIMSPGHVAAAIRSLIPKPPDIA